MSNSQPFTAHDFLAELAAAYRAGDGSASAVITRASLRIVREACDLQGAGDAGFMSREQCRAYLAEHF
jgi:hypothetical protein